MKNKTKITLVAWGAALLLAPAGWPIHPASGGEVKIVANAKVPVSALGKAELEDIFLGKKKTWSDGSTITFVVQGGAIQDDFLSTYINKTASQFDNYWRKMVFTGTGKAPKSFTSDAEVVGFVTANPGAIGFTAAESSGAKVISVK